MPKSFFKKPTQAHFGARVTKAPTRRAQFKLKNASNLEWGRVVNNRADMEYRRQLEMAKK